MGLLKTVFHVHTDYSHDTDTPVDALVAEARARGVHCITITDHDTIEGARAVAARAGSDLKIIIGEEISTANGHLIGLFLREHIEPGQSPRKTAELIHRQGGLVVVPHPFNRLFDCSLREHVYEIIDLVDVIEVSNAQNFLASPNRRARALAERLGLPMVVGVDVHHPGYLDSCYQWLRPFRGPADFLASLRQAEWVEGRHPWSYFAKTAWFTICERTGLNPPEAYGRNSPLRHQTAVVGGSA
jgi:predicted metal-dependent phosphoesterase TrpH